MLIEPRTSTDPELHALIVEQQRELVTVSGENVVYPVRTGASYLVGIVNGHAVACGAVVTLNPDTAEIQRMYVRPEFRGQGFSRAILAELEELAARAGYSVLRLETGGYLPVAMSLYRSAGYEPIATYGDYLGNPHSVCFEKRLPVLA
ncbi:GNAT superfamily N-acetyltransferase [Catenuloplanes nepalensis]|uniref:GNAT superfamily N-acetyltransferase n=1 Tax=Catenuloplanes nepalensis TaxID=587533 RepID=A0ABT9MJM7_9ACTN|nr:GNAT family N-acetyltransferase [Catenuloplanes nepalensis]MDP9791521.1 GNAT superfamily N-acetyltransferase [Catenuloplanes nepalensis]